MHSQFDLLNNELDLIYTKCSEGKFQGVPAQILVDACVQEYAGENSELKDIIRESIDPGGTNQRISRSCFKKMMTDLIISYQDGDCDSQTESQKFASSVSTPLTSLDYISDHLSLKCNTCLIASTGNGDFFMSKDLQGSLFEVVKSLKDKNDLLETDLCKADEKISKLEEKIKTSNLETRQTKKNYLNEIETLKTVLLASEEKCVSLRENYDIVLSENNKLTECMRKKRNNDVKIEDLEFSLNQTREKLAKTSQEVVQLNKLNTRLVEELRVSEDKVRDMGKVVDSLKSNIRGLEASQKECLESLMRLQWEKRRLETELAELRVFNCNSDWLTEVSGLSRGTARTSETELETIAFEEPGHHEIGVQATASRTVTICSLELASIQDTSHFGTTYSNDSFRSLRASKRYFKSQDYWKSPSCPNFECCSTSLQEEIIQAGHTFNEKKYKMLKRNNIYLLLVISAVIMVLTNLYFISFDDSLNTTNMNTFLPFLCDIRRTGIPPPL